MKKYLTAVVSLSALVTSAFAADLPSRKEPVIPPPLPPIWTGFYAGLNVGYGFGSTNGAYTRGGPLLDTWDDVQRRTLLTTGFADSSNGILLANTSNTGMSQNGVIGGGQVGYNYQWQNRYIIGLEADIQGSGITGHGVSGNVAIGELDYTTRLAPGTSRAYQERYVTGTNNTSGQINWFGTLRGRLGYLITPTLMAYATGGLTYGEVVATSEPTAWASYFSAATVRGNLAYEGNQLATGIKGYTNNLAVGWNAGGGFEWMFLNNWSIKGEAFYFDLGRQTVTSFTYGPSVKLNIPIPTGEWMTQNFTQLSYNGIIARAGVNYHFNLASMPVVAKF